MYKFLLLCFAFLLLLPGNIYLAYSLFVPEKPEGYKVEGNSNEFTCRWEKNSATLHVNSGNIIFVKAHAPQSDFLWGVKEDFYVLYYNQVCAFDFNKDYIFDLISHSGKKRFITINGKYIPISNFDLDSRTVALPNGKTMIWKSDHWQFL